jgi:hypothetical protein
MASLRQIREALKTTIEAAIPEMQGYDTVPESANLPAFWSVPRPANFVVAFGRGSDTYTFDLFVAVSRGDDEIGQVELDDYLTGAGDKSIREAIWNARTLGLTDTDATVTGFENYGAQFQIADTDHIGAVLKLQVTTSGTA